MNRVVYLGWAVVGALVVLSWWAAGRGDSRFARWLMSDRSPSAERAPWAFLRFGAAMAVLLVVVLYSLVRVKTSAIQIALLVLMPFVMFPAAMGLGGGLYLLLRRRFSSRRQ